MSEMTKRDVARILLEQDQIVLLCHRSPDGDTLGSAFGLKNALIKEGKHCAVLCADEFPAQFSYLTDSDALSFDPSFIVSIDVADERLLGTLEDTYRGKIDLAIDHHGTNKMFAKQTYVDPNAAATAEIIFEILMEMNTTITPDIANALYTGIITDTGCFQFSNTSPATHRIAAELMDRGADSFHINEALFGTKSRARIEVEQQVLQTIRYYYGGKCAIAYISESMIEESGIAQSELDGISAIPRQIEGVSVGITIKEIGGSLRVSVRTKEPVSASAICQALGGGGHERAAGCSMRGPLESAIERLLEVMKEML